MRKKCTFSMFELQSLLNISIPKVFSIISAVDTIIIIV